MTQFKIEHDKPGCIGCSACVNVAPEFWAMGDDNQSTIKGGKKLEGDKEELIIEEKDLNVNKEAAESCPVNVIHITNLDDNKKLI